MRSALAENLRGGATPGSLFLVFALIAAVLAVPSPALAANVSFSIPTKVELKVKADGTVIAPSADAWQIRNLGDEPIQLTSVSSAGFGDGETVAANSGTWSLSVNAAASQSGTMTIQPASQTGVSWSVPTLGALGAKISSKPYTAGSVSFGFQAVDDLDPDPNGTAFAVYSADDNSLDFYKRDGTPHVGHLFNGKTVTDVYVGFETAKYYSVNSGNNGDTNCPWYEHHDDTKSVTVVDSGIKPRNMGWWFQGFKSLETVNLSAIDTSLNYSFQHAFCRCTSLKNLDLSVLDSSSLVNIESICSGCESLEQANFSGISLKCSSGGSVRYMFAHCVSLKSLDIRSLNVTVVWDFIYMFYRCYSLQLDCSNWNVNAAAPHDYFNYNAPGVTLPKAWQSSTNSLDATSDAVPPVAAETAPAATEQPADTDTQEGTQEAESGQTEPDVEGKRSLDDDEAAVPTGVVGENDPAASETEGPEPSQSVPENLVDGESAEDETAPVQ